MTDETTITEKPPGESKLLGLSGRMWIGLLVTVTLCGLAAMGMKVEEPLHSGFLIIIGAIFGAPMGANRK